MTDRVFRGASGPVVLNRLVWATWLIGPGSYGLAFFCYFVVPEWVYGHSDPGPDLRLACCLPITHLAAGGCTALLALAPGPHRRRAEFRVLLLYWAGLAVWILPAFLGDEVRETVASTLPWLGSRVAVVAALLMPLVALARRVVVHARRARRR